MITDKTCYFQLVTSMDKQLDIEGSTLKSLVGIHRALMMRALRLVGWESSELN